MRRLNIFCSGNNKSGNARSAGRSLAISVSVGLQFLLAHRLRGENHIDYRFEDYQEQNGRIGVRTQGLLFEATVHPSVKLEGEFVYDAISGATPTGGPPPAGSNQVPLAQMDDTRYAGYLQSSLRWGGNQTTTPQLSYSWEHDYISAGVSLNHTIDFNEKNTTLALGASYSYDTIQPDFWYGDKEYKNTGDFLLGITQLLGPKTTFMANLTLGTAQGYLSDPYKGVRFTGYDDPNTLFPEMRPGSRFKQIGFFSLTHFVTPANGSAEISFRTYHDSYDIFSQTVTVRWFQKVGKHLILSPIFRFMNQTEAGFYATEFPGDPLLRPGDTGYVPIPKNYSADYRLSAMNTFTYGLSATVIIKDRVYLDFAYQRYDMTGTDGVTSASAYPTANIFSAGVRVWF